MTLIVVAIMTSTVIFSLQTSRYSCLDSLSCCFALCADHGALLCYEGLASVEAFWGHEARARQIFQEGSSRPDGTSRFYRGWAQFEKKHNDLEVSMSICLSV